MIKFIGNLVIALSRLTSTLLTGIAIIFALVLIFFIIAANNEDFNTYEEDEVGTAPYVPDIPHCVKYSKCWQEENVLTHKYQRKIGDLGVNGDFAKEFESRLPAALEGDIEAQIYIALLYANGEGVHQNFNKALEWICKAARNDNFVASKLYNQIGLASISDDYQPKQCNDR